MSLPRATAPTTRPDRPAGRRGRRVAPAAARCTPPGRVSRRPGAAGGGAGRRVPPGPDCGTSPRTPTMTTTTSPPTPAPAPAPGPTASLPCAETAGRVRTARDAR